MNHWIRTRLRKRVVGYLEELDREYGFDRGTHPIEMDFNQIDYCIDKIFMITKDPSLIVVGSCRLAHCCLCKIRSGHFMESDVAKMRRENAATAFNYFLKIVEDSVPA